MGGCVSHDRDNHRRRSHSSRSSATTSGTVARNKPLNRSVCRPKWKSDVPITESQLRRKREEYWDTAPAFEGRKEIWDALRGACYAVEQNDIDLAQSIINCANISLPHGTLLDCYDELGTRYQIPVYILSAPTNLADIEQSSVNDNESGTSDIDLAATAIADRERDLRDNQSISTLSQQRTTSKSPTGGGGHNPIVREIKKHRRKQKSHVDSSGNESSSTNTPTPPVLINQQQANSDQDIEIPIKFRLSNGKEHRLYCKSNEKIRNIKRRLAMLENGAIDSQTQRLFFGGKLLRDRTAICETRLQHNFVVQVILQDQPMPPNGAITTTSHVTINKDHTSYSTPVEFPEPLMNE
ncbi:unnamed protein product [Adineta steineri]|uniref:Ubiquitin-like domain-containing protein n=1 Tax=Adineta steineri TaxID=433720 RepID=A0A814HYE0_9BILA|nr:unnamed protein product [Adineta steineri]CAF1016319.1 unnamed protein product [Adineta steineri]CAF1029761.1 unnamed protein product [Adineta steineri]CAF1075400.1 unnamed protein product [Adineta steineri]CAF1179798.1 unnamed protein product [Adineta steineri]